jgi:hypothetical protein
VGDGRLRRPVFCAAFRFIEGALPDRRLENRGLESGRGALDMSGSCKEMSIENPIENSIGGGAGFLTVCCLIGGVAGVLTVCCLIGGVAGFLTVCCLIGGVAGFLTVCCLIGEGRGN